MASGGQSPVASNRSAVPHRPNQRYARPNSIDEDSDHFDDMPDSEVNNIKKVKVMMGRGQELEETADEPPPPTAVQLRSNAEQTEEMQHPAGYSAPAAPSAGSSGGNEPIEAQALPPQVAQPHYLVAAAVIEEESPLVRPYEDEILKLIIRLPVEGQTQNVQFDFHLVEDDPVKVAKEMVAELNIPQEAVLEISETISGLACTARMKQDRYSSRQNWQHEQMMAQNAV